jgi:hypothetical protein
LLAGVQAQPREALRRAELLGHIGQENCCPTVERALERARQLLTQPETA